MTDGNILQHHSRIAPVEKAGMHYINHYIIIWRNMLIDCENIATWPF
jgi:hypothetical protein